MPPKVRYTKAEITDIAYELVRERGEEYISARNLAAAMGTSTAPIFTAFESIDELMESVTRKAEALYEEYLREGLSEPIPFKGAGLGYIRFAKDEPRLFKMLFMRETPKKDGSAPSPSHYMPAADKNEGTVRASVENSYGMDEERAKRIYNHMSVYVYGLAVLYAQGGGVGVFSDEDVSRMLSEVFLALLKGEKLK